LLLAEKQFEHGGHHRQTSVAGIANTAEGEAGEEDE